MKQKDVDFMKSSIQHLWQQASLGWSSTYATAPWVLVMALPFVSFLFTVVLRSSLASLALSSILSFLLFMRIYATQVQFIAKIAKLKHKVTRYHDRAERMQDEIEAGGQELKESVREQLRLNEFSTLLQERLAELEREVKRTRFASLREIELSAKDTPTTTLKVQQTLKAKSFDEQAMTPQHFKHRKRGMTQIIKYIPCEEENAGEENEGDDDVDDHEEDEDDEDDEDDEEELDGVAGDGSDDEHAPAGKIDQTEEEAGRAKEVERDHDERTKAKDKKEEEEREYYAFLQRMDALRERDQRLMRERNEEDYSADIAAARELRPDWRDDRDESEDGSVRVQMTTGDFSSEEDVDESHVYSTSDDVSQLGSQPTTVLHRSRSSRDTDEVQALRRRLEFVEDMQRKRDAEYSAEAAAQGTSKKGKSGSSKLRPQASRVTIHLASAASTSALDHSALSVRPLTSSNSCIPTFASKSSTSPRADKSGSAHSTQAAPPPPPPPPPPPLTASPSSRFKFRFFPHMPRRHSSNSTAQLAASGHSTPTSLPTSPLLTSNTTPPAGASPPASPRGLSTSSPTHTRPFSLRKRGDSSSPPPLVSGGSGIQGSGGSSPPNKPKRGSMLLSLLPFSHEKDREKDKDRGRESGNDDEQDDDDSSDEGGNGEGGSHTKRKKHHNPFALRRMKSKEDERMISKREEKEKVKGEKEKEKKRAKEEKERVKEEKEEAKEKGKEEREPKKRLVDGVRRLYHRRTRSAAAGEIEKDL